MHNSDWQVLSRDLKPASRGSWWGHPRKTACRTKVAAGSIPACSMGVDRSSSPCYNESIESEK